MNKLFLSLICCLIWSAFSRAQTLSRETVEIITSFGTMKVKLYEETPKHKANFLELVKKGFYDSLLFHRVINSFMIQGGDPDSRSANDTAMLGMSDIGYWIPAEIDRRLYHKKGRLCAAREGDDVNPKKESSGCQFYIVQGKIHDSLSLSKAEVRVNRELVNKINYTVAFGGKSQKLKDQYMRLLYQNKEDSLKYHARQLTDPVSVEAYMNSARYTFSPSQRRDYSAAGGTPHLDGHYTVFGEVTEGLEVIDRIAAVKTDKRDRPLKNIRMYMRVSVDKK